MGLQKGDVQKMYLVFCEIAGEIAVKGKDHHVTLPNMLSFVMVEESAFTKRLFSIFKKEGADFKQFVCAMWNFCTLEEL
ncbi:hypothetical protein B484DRAFT_411157, partial [Ochromonadaceae sp. CCMP2298]